MINISTALLWEDRGSMLPASATEDGKPPSIDASGRALAETSDNKLSLVSVSQVMGKLDSDALFPPRPYASRPTESFEPLQEWEGYVTEIGRDSFNARLLDVTAGLDLVTEQVDFPISDLDDDNLRLLREGAIFRWSIGYFNRGGSKSRISKIIFRRLPAWRKSDLEAAKKQAKIVLEGLEWD